MLALRTLLEWLCVPLLVVGLQLPQASLLYWLTSALFTLAQVHSSASSLGTCLGFPALLAHVCPLHPCPKCMAAATVWAAPLLWTASALRTLAWVLHSWFSSAFWPKLR